MLGLLNVPTSDGERNILNADLFVSNLKHTLDSFKFNTNIKYTVYRNVTIYEISWNDDKTYDDIYALRKEIALALGINAKELSIENKGNNKAEIIQRNMKIDTLSLKEVLTNFKDHSFKIALGLDDYDNVVCFDLNKDKNLLVTGVSGTGKTNLFNVMILNILINSSDTKIIILDSQGINYNIYNGVCQVVNKEEDIIKKIKLLRKDFEERVKVGNKERIVVFIDEIYEILKLDNSIKNDINYLLELGSMMNIHLILSTDSITQDDTYDLFNRDNVSKLSFYLTSKNEYNMFFNEPVTAKLKKDGMYKSALEKMTRITIPLVMDDEIERVVNYARNEKK